MAKASLQKQAEGADHMSQVSSRPSGYLRLVPDAEKLELLDTRLTPPRLRGPLVEREDLFARLDEGLEQRITLLSAPAGFGKTTLVCSWLAARAAYSGMPPAAWVTLDEQENDPVSFWGYILTACQVFQEGSGEASLNVLRRLQQPFESILTVFLNELAQMNGRGILVLEDYHTIIAPRVHETLTFLLDHVPETLHVILITRADPPLPLARWRARGDLHDLRAVDLRFSPAETQAFLQKTLPFPLTMETMERLDERVEGWPAGLRLFTLALRGHRSPRESKALLATFSGSHQHILTYLVADVLSAQPLPVQDFLLRTSLLTRLNASLCEALTERQDSAPMLAQLDQANLFLFPLDDSGQWYRYHALFAEAMQHEARARLGEETWRELYHRASLWYEQHEMPLDAIEAAIDGEDNERAAILMEQLSDPQVLQNEYFALVRLADRLPVEQLRERPALCLIYAMGLLYREDRRAPATPGRVEHVLRMAERVWREQGYAAGLGEIEALRSSIAWWQADYAQSFARARRSLDLLAADDLLWRGSSQLSLAMAEVFAGRTVPAQHMLVEARLTNEAAGNHYAVRAAQFMLGELFLQRGELRLAAQMYQQLFNEAEAVQDITDIGSACRQLGVVAYEWNKLETAREALAQALDVARRCADDEALAYATLVLARLDRLAAARDEGSERPDLVALTARMQRWPHLLHAIHACRARLALADGDLLTAQQQIETCTQFSNSDIFLQQEALARLKVRLLLARNATAEALELLLTWQRATQERGLTQSLLEILVLQALAHHARREEAQAHDVLLQALILARPEGYQRLFLDEGPVMHDLLRAVVPEIREEQVREYTRGLLQAFARERNDDAYGRVVSGKGEPQPGEPLSPQERRVLRLLAAGYTNPEIAGELVVSINTIKTQVQSIYYKLGVNNRYEARELAHRLQLV